MHPAAEPHPPHNSTTVIAVSRSQPATHAIHSQPTLTAIVRSPSTSPLVLSADVGIEGHQSAVHDAPVYAFFAKHYDYWTTRLGVERSAWDWAFWGENLTIKGPDGLDETNVHLGDRWVFYGPGGQRAILEVCGGRNPCSRLAWRCGQPSSWLSEVARTGYCGVYLNIVRGGSIAPGDTLTVVPTSHADAVPVASIAQCAFSPIEDPSTRALAARILAVPSLQNMNKQIITRKLMIIQERDSVAQGHWAGWRNLEIVKIFTESASVKSFCLAASDHRPLAPYVPGQFLTIKLPSGQIRCWSISSWSPSSPTEIPPFYRITIQKGTSASLYLHEKASIGTQLLTRSPSGSFVPDWSREFPARQIYVGAGIGMTPILSMLQAQFSHPTIRRTPAILIQIARNSDNDIPSFQTDLPTSSLLRVIKFYTAPIVGVDVQGRDFDQTGRPTADFFRQLLADPYQIDPLQIKPIELPGTASSCYICGPTLFIASMRSFIESAKIPPKAIRSETFSVKPMGLSIGENIQEYGLEESTVIFKRQSKSATWKESESLSILQLAEKEALNPDFGCRMGECGACEMKILQGEARTFVTNIDGRQSKDKRAGDVIRSCCTLPTTAMLELDF